MMFGNKNKVIDILAKCFAVIIASLSLSVMILVVYCFVTGKGSNLSDKLFILCVVFQVAAYTFGQWRIQLQVMRAKQLTYIRHFLSSVSMMAITLCLIASFVFFMKQDNNPSIVFLISSIILLLVVNTIRGKVELD